MIIIISYEFIHIELFLFGNIIHTSGNYAVDCASKVAWVEQGEVVFVVAVFATFACQTRHTRIRKYRLLPCL